MHVRMSTVGIWELFSLSPVVGDRRGKEDDFVTDDER